MPAKYYSNSSSFRLVKVEKVQRSQKSQRGDDEGRDESRVVRSSLAWVSSHCYPPQLHQSQRAWKEKY